jgi:hypothetical protein
LIFFNYDFYILLYSDPELGAGAETSHTGSSSGSTTLGTAAKYYCFCCSKYKFILKINGFLAKCLKTDFLKYRLPNISFTRADPDLVAKRSGSTTQIYLFRNPSASLMND